MKEPIRQTPYQRTGVYYFLSGFRLIFAKGLKRYTLIPLLLNTLLFLFIWSFALYELHLLVGWLNSHIPSWLHGLSVLIYLIAIIGLLLFSAWFFSLFALILAAPFYAFLCEKVTLELGGKHPDTPLTFKQFLQIAPKALSREIMKMLSFLPWVIAILVYYFIPVLNLFTGVFWLMLLSWFNVIAYVDYPFDNHQISFQNMKHQLRQKPFLSFGFGFTATLFLMVPFFNIFVIPAAIAGATKMYLGEFASNSV